MRYGIKVIDLATAQPQQVPRLPRWLRTADVEAHDGRGDVTFTLLAHEALAFPDQVAAFEFWRQQSTARPLRPDGQPNRPLTAFTVSIEELP